MGGLIRWTKKKKEEDLEESIKDIDSNKEEIKLELDLFKKEDIAILREKARRYDELISGEKGNFLRRNKIID